MRNRSPAENCMLLLFAPLGDAVTLRPRTYRVLAHELEQMQKIPADRELSEHDLYRLGLSKEDSLLILQKLQQSDLLWHHLNTMEQSGISVLTRISPEYPLQLLHTMGPKAPFLLYCAGNLDLFSTCCISLVGSRQLRPAGEQFAKALGQATAQLGFTYVSGGAPGADTVGFTAAQDAGGSSILFLPDSLQKRMLTMQKPLDSGQLLLVSEAGPNFPFSVSRAYSRNRLIHAIGEKVFVAQTDCGTGGTWNGTIENLQNSWSPVFVCCDEPDNLGARGLIEHGAQGVTASQLTDLNSFTSAQISLFNRCSGPI